MYVISRDDLKSVLHEVIGEIVYEPSKALLDRAGLAKLLDVSLSKVDELRALPGFPKLALGPSTERFERDAVLAYLRAQSAGGN